ncbi:MAG: hypothetical protein QFE16_15140 [Pseudomonadota bacterium]|nr:hypothetical protein [Pseudomonadota bacterium]
MKTVTAENVPGRYASPAFLLISCFVFSPGALFAQVPPVKAELPIVKVGDHWKYEQNDRRTGVKEAEFDRTVTAVTATQIDGKENEGKFVWTRELNTIESSTVAVSGESKTLSFPLEIGKKWDYKYNYANKLNPTQGRWQLEANVVAFEKVHVLAGEFEAFKIEYRGFWNNDTTGKHGRLNVTNWFAPSARSVVKTEYDDGYNNWVRQLVEYQLQP